MARYAAVVEVAATATSVPSPTQKDSFIRVENLGDPDSGPDVWVALVDYDEAGDALIVTAEGAEECVRVRPGTSQLFRYRTAYQMISATGTVDVLVQSSNGLE